jgi:hypothetical protein
VDYSSDTPFDSIENSHHYIQLLVEAIAEAEIDVSAEIALAEADGATRRLEALQLVKFKLAKLHSHMSGSACVLNDLRSLRRLLLEERRPSVRTFKQSGS